MKKKDIAYAPSWAKLYNDQLLRGYRTRETPIVGYILEEREIRGEAYKKILTYDGAYWVRAKHLYDIHPDCLEEANLAWEKRLEARP